MTCVGVMYQPPGFPGAGFQAYPREPCSLDFSIRHSQTFAKLQEPLDLGTSSFAPVATTSTSHDNNNLKPSTATKAVSSPSSSTAFASPAPAFPSKTSPTVFPQQVYREPTRSASPSLLSSSISSPPSDAFAHHHHHNNSSNNYNNSSSNLYNLHHPQHAHQHLQQNPEKHHRSRQTKCENDIHSAHEGDQKLGPVRTDYLGINCVLNTFFTGDVRTAVDDHFTKSMDNQSRQQRSSQDGTKSIESLPMSERDLPPSFWNSSYYQLHHAYNYHHHHHSFFDQSSISANNYSYHHHPFHSLGASASSSFGASSNLNIGHAQNSDTHILPGGGTGCSSSSTGVGAGLISGLGSSNDLSPFQGHMSHPYLSPALQGLSNLQSAATSDPWSAYCNSFTSPAAAAAASVPYPHRPVPYDFSSYPSTRRFGQKYSSFLMQPSAMRSTHLGTVAGHCDVSKPSDFSSSSRSRYSDPRLGADYSSSHHGSFTAIDATSLQDAPAKDLYWF
ncbi:hypothetical protein EGW08_017139 [Elysia chlorotica]|uniref:Transcription cofactor vestigial-like protein 2 n=1 Tax=Elysia chlorotica TaxID=188477 RepID=A0A433T0N5_ELYCH|nr:hypothetical protein EGW08_017139 [Elysia chlorotica]